MTAITAITAITTVPGVPPGPPIALHRSRIMNRVRHALALALAPLLTSLLAACGGGGGGGGGGGTDTAAPNSALEQVAPGDWLVIGTSTAAGIGAPAGEGWADLLARAVAGDGVRVINAARAGTLTYHWLPAATPRPPQRPATIAALDIRSLMPEKPRLVILGFPSNDAMAGIPARETIDNLLLLRRAALERGAVVLVSSSQPRNDADAAQRAVMQAVDAAMSADLGACFVDVRGDLLGNDGGLKPALAAGDGVHLNAQGHRRLFERIMQALTGGHCRPPPR